jgi:hypothetical protein
MDQKVWLGSDDQSESLQRGGHVNLRIDQAAAAALDLAQIVYVTVGRDGPKNISRVDTTQFIGARQVVDIQFNASATATLPSHLGRTF